MTSETKISRRDFLKVFGAVGAGAILAACRGDSWLTPDAGATQTPFPSSLPTEKPPQDIEPGRILDLEKDSGLLTPEITKEFTDFDASHPELAGRDVYKFAIQSPIGQIGFVTYELKSEEIETAIIAQSPDGKTAISIPDRALYATTKDTVTGEYNWSRLLGIATPGASEDTKIVSWFYLPEGYPKAEEITPLNLDYPVLAYQMPNNSELLFWYPAMADGKPTWSSDYQMAMVSRYESLPEGARKVLFSLLPVEPTPTPEATALESLFEEGGIMKSEHLTAKVNKEVMNYFGINKVTLDPEIMEKIYKLFMVRWAWAEAQHLDDPRLTMFKDVNQQSLEEMLAAYEKNAALGDQGFDYVFDFGKGVEGPVKGVEIYLMGKENNTAWQLLFAQLLESGIEYQAFHIPGWGPKSIVTLGSDGVLKFYHAGMEMFKDVKYLGRYFGDIYTTVLNGGEYAIGEEFKRGSSTAADAMYDLIGCEGYCRMEENSESSFEFKYK